MSNSNPKKRPHRSHNRTPKIYRWADIASEALIYFTILWGPWAFGTVHDWAILTMNLASYGIGTLLLVKWGIRYATGYHPPRWTTQKNGPSTTTPPKRDWRTKTVAILTIYLLGYILISILNVRATFNHDFNFFENYNENYIKWLPHTYDQSATIQSFLNFLGLACCFWGVRDWLLGKTRKERMESEEPEEASDHYFGEELSTPSIPIRLKRLLWLLSISGGLLALIGIIQRLDGTPKLLWIYERARFGTSTQSFGPFGYRSNGASYLNMILPISIGFLMWAVQIARSARMKTGRKPTESHLTLIPAICMMVAAPFVSLSRGGFVVLGCMLLAGIIMILVNRKLLRGRQRLGLSILILAGIGLSYYLGWEPLLTRLNSQNPWHETRIDQPNYADTITFKGNLPSPPYDKDHQLFQITDSQTSKFREAFYNTTLYKNGNLRVLLYNQFTQSHINMTYTNLAQALDKGFLELEISRSDKGIEATANSEPLNGIENTAGKAPPTWSHPVIPNEILLHKKAAIKTGEPDLESRLLSIHPQPTDGIESNQNNEPYELQLDNAWNLVNFISQMSSRDRIYEDSWRMAKDYQWLGCGAGAWSTVYFLYHDADEAWDAWVHCDWLEYWITLGLFGTIPGLVWFGMTVIPSKNQLGFPTANWIRIGLNLAIAGCLIHALFDFPLQVISIMHLFVILCAIKMVATVKAEQR